MRLAIGIAAMAMAVPGTAIAHAVPGSEAFACDAPAGRSAYYQRPLGPAPIRLNAKVHVNVVRASGGWSPVVNVSLVSEDESGGGSRVGIRLLPDGVAQSIDVENMFPGAPNVSRLPNAVADIDRDVPITIEITAKHFRVGIGQFWTVPNTLPSAGWRLSLSCSSIDAHIDDIVIEKP